MTSSPSTCPHSSKPLFEVSTVDGPLVPGVDQLEEEHGAVLADRQVADLVDDEQRGMRQHAQPPGQRSRGPGVGERVDQSRQRPVVDASAGLGGRDRQADRQMRLTP